MLITVIIRKSLIKLLYLKISVIDVSFVFLPCLK